MPTIDWDKLIDIFNQAQDLPADERERFLDEACQGNESLRKEIESLLDSNEKAKSFLEHPVAGALAGSDGWRLKIGQRISHYTILAPIASGGMGEIYLAEDVRLHRKVALKTLREELFNDHERVRRFQREADAVSTLNHPNILTIYEFDHIDGTHFLAAEHIKGETLREKIRRGPLRLAEALEIALQSATALEAAHRAGVVHRDIKPENIMIRDDGYVKVLDFGLAKLTENAASDPEAPTRPVLKTGTDIIMGTVNYMSPEQARGTGVDHRTDIFSLGIILYEMLAGVIPFRGLSTADVIAAIIAASPAPIGALPDATPRELRRIVSKCLEKDQRERYQTAADLYLDLKRVSRTSDSDTEAETSNTADSPTGSSLDSPNKGDFTPIHNSSRRAMWRGISALAVGLSAVIAAFIFVWPRLQSPSAQTEIKTLAVLPLKPLDASENYLGLGVADAIIRRISQTGKLTVRPTSSVRRYLNEDTDALSAAKQLGADAILEGTLQRSGDRLRISVNLLRVSDGKSLWVDNFDLRTSDIFAVQDTVGQQVANRLQLRLDPAQAQRFAMEYMPNAIAYEYFLKGVYSLDQRGIDITGKPQNEATIELFKKSIDADPNYALARALLAYAYVWMAVYVDEANQSEWVELAKEEIQRAEALDPQLAETHVARHHVLLSAKEGFLIEAAARELVAAKQLNPNVAGLDLSVSYNHLGLEDMFDKEMKRTLEIDPTSEFNKARFADQLMWSERYDDWLAFQQRYSDGKPNVRYLLAKGRLDEAQQQIDPILEKEPGFFEISLKAILTALKGDTQAAVSQVPLLIGKLPFKNNSYHHATYDLACINALHGNSAEAVKWLRETAATGFPSYPLFERDHYLDRIRESPEFIQFMTEMKALNGRVKQEFAR